MTDRPFQMFTLDGNLIDAEEGDEILVVFRSDFALGEFWRRYFVKRASGEKIELAGPEMVWP